MDPAALFKALSDPTRLRCLSLLSNHEALCVCELTHALALPQPKVSHHLATLRRVELVKDRKEGLWIYYCINPELPPWIAKVIETTAAGIKEQEPFASDVMALAETSNSSSAICNA
ncbi:MAG: metalloregulator ArsR/SmtB family transcription factor [Candidatus Thiodiazotropha sp. (ex Epidulcina cf. delphinae)]|nr:metalloregulator ArsR/SmtB family transcription factor [Candidatus Thiodiazotropha sp. (ex Epidulcina cf. delphinae)]